MPNWKAVQKLPLEEQVVRYVQHLNKKPNDAAIWFDLGITYKLLRRWKDCIEANERALSIVVDDEDPAWWNLGIAATALRDWVLARKAWRGYGLEIEGDDGPVSCDYGMAPVRLPHGEVVWGTRLDPARLVIRNIPFPGNHYRWGDIVLHDGAPNGEREVDGQMYGVFDVLEKWSPSEIPTYEVTIVCPAANDAAALIELFEHSGFAAEDWSANVRTLCKACSTGNPGKHDHPFGSDNERERRFGIASSKGHAEKLLMDWATHNEGRSYSPLQLCE